LDDVLIKAIEDKSLPIITAILKTIGGLYQGYKNYDE
jgi:hypothetical protein